MATDQEINALKRKINQKRSETSTSTSGGSFGRERLERGVADYTDAEYVLIMKAWAGGLPNAGPSDRPTFREMFAIDAAGEIAAREEPTPPQIAFFKSNLNVFNDAQKDKIDKFLILSGDISSTGINTRFVNTKSQFENEVRGRVNSDLMRAYALVKMNDFVIKAFGLSLQWEMPDVSGKVSNKVYQAYNSQKDSIEIPYFELEAPKGEIKAGEISPLGSITDIDQKGPIPFNGQEALDGGYLKYIDEIIKDRETLGESTYQQILDTNVRSTRDVFVNSIRQLHVFKRREAKFLTLAEIDPTSIGEDKLDSNKLSLIYNKKLNKSLGELGEGALPDASPIDFEARKKVFEQCALLSDIKNLSSKYSDKILKDNIYDGRLYLAETPQSSPAIAMNKLLLPKREGIKSFLEITPDVAAMLVPKIELFLVRQNEKNKTEKVRFEFPTSTTANIEQTFKGSTNSKGTEFGIKSFSFSFEGTNPATSRNDIVAHLTLFFQNFNDFVSDQYNPKFVDLILYDRGNKQSHGPNSIAKNQYSPDYYRIMAEVGWQIPTDPSIKTEINKRTGMNYEELKTALQKTNKSFYLNMVEHEMDFKEDGTFEVKAEYRAYIESALKGPEFDALATTDILKRRSQRQKEYQDVIDKGECNIESLIQLNRAFQVEDLELIKEAYQSVIGRLLCRGRIFIAQPNSIDIQSFSNTGYFKQPCRWDYDGLDGEAPESALSTTKATINYFFLGDLIHTILDSGYDIQEFSNIVTPFENTNVVLFPFELQDGSERIEINIADIPCSVDFFIEWYTENVIAPERQTYPIMNFIRDLANKLIVDLLSEQCRYQPLENKIRFNTSTIVAKKNDNGDPIGSMTKGGTKRLDIGKEYSNDALPLLTDDSETKFENYHNYLIIYPIYSNIQHQGRGTEFIDGSRGTYHFNIGSDRGLVKKIKFSKVDMQYIRESRFFQQGTQNLSQLAAVYKASIDMIGNTIYYPGMEIFINPRGLGLQGDPTTQGSIANSLGFGGYHMVTRVNSSITPSSFSTNIEAMFVYSGDGTSPTTFRNTSGQDENIENRSEQSANCNTIINNAETNVQIISRPGQVDFKELQSLTANSNQASRQAAAEAQQALFDRAEALGSATFAGPIQQTEE